MSNDGSLIGGVYPKERNPNAPDWKIIECNINLPQFSEFVRAWKAINPDKEWLNMEFLISKSGKPYAKENTFEPKQKQQASIQADPGF